MAPIAFRIGRYSSTDGDRQLDRQAADTLALCQANGYEDGGWFGVDDESGNVDTRRRQGKSDVPPTIAWAMREVMAAKDRWPRRPVILVGWKEARLWRDVSEKEAVRRFLKQWKDVTWHTYEGVKDPHSATDTLVSTVVAGGNQFYADSVREAVMRAHEERLRAGKPVTGWPGFGHRRDGDRWVADETEAPLLRAAIQDVLQGAPTASIVKRWTEAGVPTRLGGNWTISTIRKMLTAPRLAGILVHAGREVGRTDYIEALIDEPTLRRLQAKLSARKATRQRLGMQLLTGVLLCGRCGAPMNSNMKGSKPNVRVYSCRACGGVNINGEAVDRVMTDALFRALEDSGASTIDSHEKGATDTILEELAVLDAEEAELADAAAELPVSVIRAKGGAIEKRRMQLRRQLGLAQEASDANAWFTRSAEVRAAWDSYPTDKKRNVILDVLGRMTVLPGGAGHQATPERVAARLRRLAP